MKVLFVTSEALPFAASGGLADVSGSLPHAMRVRLVGCRVVLPLYDVPTKLRYRNLLYTAVTRAKKLLVVVGDESVWLEMAANDKKTLRYTFLKQFLKEADIYETGNIGS